MSQFNNLPFRNQRQQRQSPERQRLSARTDLKCANGGCITGYQYQPNGNQMCMINYETYDIAWRMCKKFHCQLIVKYQINRDGRYQGILSNFARYL